MKSHIERLSPSSEFFLVTILFFAYPIFNSFKALYIRITYNKLPHFTDLGVARMISFEIIVLAAALTILYWRGYSNQDINLTINPKSSLYGLWLLLKYYLVSIAIFFIPLLILAKFFRPTLSSATNPFFSMNLSYISIIAFAIINPIFEELSIIGYLFSSIEKIKGTYPALFISLVVRLSYHTYQGFGILVVTVFGYILGMAYVKKRNIWPLIVCHTCVDLISAITNKLLFGS
jgi:membrane protease YdiL (CAAX protease family)